MTIFSKLGMMLSALRSSPLYSLIRKYSFDPNASKEIVQKLEDGFVPLLRQARGFVAYY